MLVDLLFILILIFINREGNGGSCDELLMSPFYVGTKITFFVRLGSCRCQIVTL